MLCDVESGEFGAFDVCGRAVVGTIACRGFCDADWLSYIFVRYSARIVYYYSHLMCAPMLSARVA